MKDISKIPEGPYCHGVLTCEPNDDPRKPPKLLAPYRCPYWKLKEQGKGYCEYLELGDDDVFPRQVNGNGDPYKIFYLWDEVKICDINMGEDEDER